MPLRPFMFSALVFLALATMLVAAPASASPFAITYGGDSVEQTIEVVTDERSLPRSDIILGGRTFQQLDVGEGLNYDDVSLPDLPTIHRLIAVEPGLYYEAHVERADPVVIDDILLAPVQPDAPDTGVRAPFRMNDELYETDMEVGSETVVLGEIARLGGIDVMPVKLTPLQYNPALRRLTVWRHITVRVHATGQIPFHRPAPPALRTEGLTSFQYAQIRNLVENIDARLATLRRTDVDTVLVLATPDLSGAARSYVDQMPLAGVNYEIQEIQSGLPSTTIQALIKSRYDRGGLDSVLLFGDEVKIPMHEWSRGVPGDSFYGFVDGRDWMADIGVGRLPVSDLSEVDVLITKLSRYALLQRSGHTNKNVLLIAHKEEYPAKYTGNMERVRTAANPRGLAFTTRYGGAGASNASVIDAVSRDPGYAIVAYRGHGTSDTWVGWSADSSSFGEADVARLANADENLAVFLNVACSTGALQSTLPSLAEMQLFHGSGAVGVLAATILSATTTNHKFNEYLFSYMQTEANLRLSNIIALANNRIVRDNGGNIVNNTKMYILLADPSLAPWIR